MKRSLVILALVSLVWVALPHGAFGQSIICLSYDSKDTCLEHSFSCSWCSSLQLCQPSDWPCPACEDIFYEDCGGVDYPGCRKCLLTVTCQDIDKPCYCGNGEINVGEECDSTPQCDPVYCTCGEGYIKDLNHPPYCCCDECTCNGIASTDASVCSGHGVCLDADTCLCEEGWAGEDCETSVPVCGNGIVETGEECDSTPQCDPIMCTCVEGFTPDGSGGCEPSFSCTGFNPPFDEKLTLKKKTKRAIPLKIQLFHNGTLITDQNIPSPPVVEVDYDGVIYDDGNDGTDVLEPLGNANDGNQFRFDVGSECWIFNLGTKQFDSPGTYEVRVKAGIGYSIEPTCIQQFELLD